MSAPEVLDAHHHVWDPRVRPQPWIDRPCSRIQSPTARNAAASRGSTEPRPVGPTFRIMLPPLETDVISIWTSNSGAL